MLALSQKGLSYHNFRAQGLKPPQGQLGFFKDFKLQGLKKGLNVSKTSKPFRVEDLQDLILSSFGGGVGTVNSTMGILVLEGLLVFQGYSKISSFSRDEGSFLKGIKIPKLHSLRSKFR